MFSIQYTKEEREKLLHPIFPVEKNPPEGINDSELIREKGLKESDAYPVNLVPHGFGEDCSTILDCLESCVKKYKNKNLFGFRKVLKEYVEIDKMSKKKIVTKEHSAVEWISYEQVWEMVNKVALGMKIFLPEMEKGDIVGFYLETCKEYIVFLHSCFLNGSTVATVYPNLGVDGLVKVINETKLSLIICDAYQLEKIDETLKKNCPSLKKIVIVGTTKYETKNFEVVNIYDLLLMGDKEKKIVINEKDRPVGKDIAIIMYTSGTTGDPKGVLQAHENLVAAIRTIFDRLKAKKDRSHYYLCYLPLSHSFENLATHFAIFAGSEIGFGNPRTLVAKRGGAKFKGDLDLFKPTLFIGVPRIFETMRKGILSKVNSKSWLNRYLFHTVLEKKIAQLKKGNVKYYSYLDNVVFGKIRKMFGGRLELLVSGAAPLSVETNYFLQSVFGPYCTVIQGYGLSESLSANFSQDPHVFEGVGCVGQPFNNCALKLRDCPELNYFVKDNVGEVLIGGPIITHGYFAKPKITEKTFFVDGKGIKWLKSGDIGKIDDKNNLYIIDRVKHLAKLSGGEYVPLEHLETVYGTSSFVQPAGMCVIASSLESYLVAIVLIEPSFVNTWAKEGNLNMDLIDLVKTRKLKEAVLKSFENIAKENDKKGFEMIRNILVLNESWTAENGMLNPASKLRRNKILEKYAEQIKGLYKTDGGGVKVKEEEEKKTEIPSFYQTMKPV